MKGHETCPKRQCASCFSPTWYWCFINVASGFQFVVTMAITRTTAFTSQRKMRIVSLIVGICLVVCLAADVVESSSTGVASTKRASHSSGTGRRRQQRFLRSRRVQDSLPAPINNEPIQPLGSPSALGILPADAPATQSAPVQGEAAVEDNAALSPAGESGAQGVQGEATQSMGEALLAAAFPNIPASFERQEGNGGQNNSQVGAYGSESAPGLGINPSVLQSGILGVLPVTIPENQNVSGEVETPAAENSPSGESGAQEEAAQPVRDTYSPPPPAFSTPPETQEGANGGAPPPGANEGQNIAPPAGNEGRDVTPPPPPPENEESQITPPPPERHSTVPEPEGNGGRSNTPPTGNGSQGGTPSYYHQAEEYAGGDGKIDANGEIFPGTIPVTDDEVMEEIKEEERKVRTIGGFGIFLAIFAMIFTAWQMSDNPDGIYAAMCRLIITIMGLVIRIMLSPCRSCFGGSHGSRNYAGHMPVSTMDYGFRDPALELS